MTTATLFPAAGTEPAGDLRSDVGPFEEPGPGEIVAEEAGTWFATHLR
jgi:hypothetical protein